MVDFYFYWFSQIYFRSHDVFNGVIIDRTFFVSLIANLASLFGCCVLTFYLLDSRLSDKLACSSSTRSRAFRVYNRDEILESKCKFDTSPVSCAQTTCIDFGRRLMTAHYWRCGNRGSHKIIPLNLMITIGAREKTRATCAGNWLFYSRCIRVLYLSLQGVVSLARESSTIQFCEGIIFSQPRETIRNNTWINLETEMAKW